MLVVVLVGAFTWADVGGLSRRSKIGIGIITLVTVWMIFKEGFVRHDTHDLIFFAVAPLVLAAFAPRHRPWLLVPGVLVLTGIFVIAADGNVPILRPTGFGGSQPLFRSGNPRLLQPIGCGHRTIASYRCANTYALPSRMVAMMQGQTVDVSPWEQNVAWAYPKIRFDPLPVIQDYSAYTPSLDQLDASYLASSDAPRFILRQPGLAIDGRDPHSSRRAPNWPSSAATTRWRRMHRGNSSNGGPTAADRCGRSDTVTTGFRHWVTVPTAPAGDAIVARFQLSLGWLYKPGAVLFKPENVSIQYNGNAKNSWRFVTATAPTPTCSTPPRTLGYYSGFMPVPLTSLRFSIAGGYPTSAGVTVRFYEVHVAPVAGGNGQVLPANDHEVLRPANGATVSGTVPLDASATDY